MLTMHINYNDQSLTAIDRDGEPWFTAAVAGAGLGYAEGNERKGVNYLYGQHRDEFSDADTGVVKTTSPGGMQQTRIFSLSGIVLLGFFSGTEKAKAFRKWAKAELEKRMAHQLGYRAEPVATSAIPTSKYVALLEEHIELLRAKSKTDTQPKRRAWSTEDRAEAFDLKSKGATYEEIGQRLGRPASSIESMFRNARNRTKNAKTKPTA